MIEDLTKEQLCEYLNKYFSILEGNFKYSYGKKIPYQEITTMCHDINNMLIKLNEFDYKKSGQYCINNFIPLLELLLKIDTNKYSLEKYDKFLKNSYRISARISLENYMIYREWDDETKFYAPRYEILSGYIHYLQELALNPKFRMIVFNAPSGFGKTFPEKISEAWNFGVDDTQTVLSLCSNEDVVKGGSRTVIDEIKSEKFGEVFPNLRWDEEDKNFFLKETEANWKLRNCKLSSSYYAKTTQSNVVGTRASQRIHIDDLYPDYQDAMNTNLNEYYLNKYLTVWTKRFVQNKIPKIVVTGTLWASGDFIALLIQMLEKNYEFEPDPKYKYARISKNKDIVIIQVPALDYESGESTCPDIKSTQEILEDKNSMDEYLFETNFQQRPVDPEQLFFSYNKLRCYKTIPPTEYIGTYAVIDATRKSGKDFFAMPIFAKVPNENTFDYYLKDVIFTKNATKDMYDEVVDKIIEHHIITLVIESNVTSELKQAIEKKLKNKNVSYCIIMEKYNTQNKSARIENQKGNIIRRLFFPLKTIFGKNSEMGKFMDNLTLYNSNGRNANDDAPDSCAMFCSEIIEENSKSAKAKAIKRPF